MSRPPVVVDDDSVTISVSGGIGPQGPPGAGGVVSINDLAGALTLAVVGGTVAAAGSTITITVAGGGGSLAWADITGKPASFTPSAHASSHATGGSDPLALAIGQITGLQTALDGKQASGSYAAASHGHAATAITYPGGPVGNVTGATVNEALDSIDSNLENRISTAQFAASFSTGLTVAAGIVSVSFGTTSTTVCVGNDARLGDAREWSADTISQAEAEAGTATTRRAFTALRVFQAIAAWWNASAAKTKLDGIATGATANSTDAQLRDRSTHTGTQAWTTITATPTTLAGYGITDAASSSHAHGNITNAGAIGSTSGLPVITTTGGVLTVGAFGSTAGTFAQGNDSRFLTDGNKGDITVSASGATWAINAGAVVTADIADGAVTLAKTTGVQKTITSGTAAPTGGSDGDIYLQYS